MKNYFQSQLNFLKSALRNPSMGSNPAGTWQMGFEALADDAWEYGLSPTIKGLSLMGGIGLGGYALHSATSSDENVRKSAIGLGLVGGGAVLGAGVGLGMAGKAAGWPAKLMGAGKGMAVGAGLGLIGAGAAIGGPGMAAGAAGLLASPILAGGFLRGAFGAAGGAKGLGLAAIHAGTAVGGVALNTARGLEFAARSVLTGGIRGVQGPLDAWFPNFRNLGGVTAAKASVDRTVYTKLRNSGTGHAAAVKAATITKGNTWDIRRFAPNPRIVRRMTGIGAVAAAGAALSEAASPMIAPPSAFFDGRYMRHTNDLGANAHYANAVLGPNSVQFGSQDMGRIIAAAF